MVERIHAQSDSSIGGDIRRLSIEIITKSYDHHKNHARFQEQQRSWFFVAYLTFSGVLISGIINNFQKDGYVINTASSLLVIILFFHMIISILVALGISKLSREFRRHFHQADKIIDKLKINEYIVNSALLEILNASSLGTSGDHQTGIRKIIAKRFGLAAIHNYIISIFIGFDAGLVSYLFSKNPLICGIVFAIFSISSIITLTYHNKILAIDQ